MHPLAMALALLMRLWQTFGYMNLFLLTAAGVLAMWRPPLRDRGKESADRAGCAIFFPGSDRSLCLGYGDDRWKQCWRGTCFRLFRWWS